MTYPSDGSYLTGAGMPSGMSSSGMPSLGGPGAPLAGAEPAKGRGRRGKKKNSSGEDKPQPTKKVANKQFKIALLFAALVAVVLGGTMYQSKSGGEYVVVTRSAIAANTPIDGSMLMAVQMSKSLQQPGAVVSTNANAALSQALTAVKGERSQFPMTANQQLIPDQFKGSAVANLGTPLGPNERLVSFQASVSASVAGSIQPGDYVDVYATNSTVAGLIAQAVPVVSVTVSEQAYNSIADAQSSNKNVKASDVLPGTPVPGTYVVRVTADTVAKIIAADAGGKIYLTYRGPNAGNTPTSPSTILQAICGNQPAATPGCPTS